MAMTIDEKIEEWKKKLLDTGLRSRLLNFKETKASIGIKSPNFESLYKKIVSDEKELSFSYVPFYKAQESEKNEDEVVTPGDIETSCTPRETCRRLDVLRARTKASNEELGINTLYLSFGFLEWCDPASKVYCKAPLILVPVALSIESILKPFKLSIHEDEIVVNPTLIYKLEKDFGVKMPEFDPANDRVSDFLEKINKKLKKKEEFKTWKVHSNVTLSLLSFLKINMYKDLEKRRDTIKENKIIQALVGKDTLNPFFADFNTSFEHDTISPQQIYQVVDADSSQQDAIALSKQGKSFILQGPPGTGKSQTITNIIAEALADGKKVLFVSEKMAALDVVHNRLENTGLADFCLVLHSHKANKKEVLESFNKVLNLRPITLSNSISTELSDLKKHRDELNQYNRQLHTKIEPLGWSAFNAHGILAKLDKVPHVDFEIKNVQSINKDDYYTLKNLAKEFQKAQGSLTENYDENCWRGCKLESFSPREQLRLSESLEALEKKLSITKNLCCQAKDIGFCANVTAHNICEYSDAIDFCDHSRKVPLQLITAKNLSKVEVTAREWNDACNKYKKLHNSLSEVAKENYYKIPAKDKMRNIDECLDNCLDMYRNYYSSKEPLLTDLDTLLQLALNSKEHLTELVDYLGKVYQDFLTIGIYSYDKLKNLPEILLAYGVDIKPQDCWFYSQDLPAIEKQNICKKASSTVKVRNELRQKLLSIFNESILELSCNDLLIDLREKYSSISRVFKLSYWKITKMIRAHLKNPKYKLSYQDYIQQASDVIQYQKYELDLQAHKDEYERALGGNYAGPETIFENVSKAIQAFDILKKYFTVIPGTVKQSLISGNNIHKYDDFANRISNIAAANSIDDLLIRLAGTNSNNDIRTLLDISTNTANNLQIAKDELAATESLLKNVYQRNAQYDALSKLSEYQGIQTDFENSADSLNTQFSFLMNGLETDWATIFSCLEWTKKFKGLASKFAMTDKLQESIANCEISINSLKKISDEFRSFNQKCKDDISTFADLFDETISIKDLALDDLFEKTCRCRNNLKDLENWISFNIAIKKCHEHGLHDFVTKVLERHIDSSVITKIFEKTFALSWLESIHTSNPSIAQFKSKTHNSLVNEFKDLDKKQFEFAKLRIREKIIDAIPSTSQTGESNILRREIGKQRRQMPIRLLFAEIPNLLPKLKPCLMMSPLSVSQYLQSGSYQFDMVVFDEASQIKTENAIGAISRAKQVIVAGDIHQLPPTNFFESTSDADYDDDDENENSYQDGFESILDEIGSALPQVTLKWHYRSKSEALITFSNATIYGNSLITFPSPFENTENYGVKFVHVADGFYDRGKTRQNKREAEIIADMVFDHMQKHPEKSLGVITFSDAQQRCVETEIRNRRIQNAAFEEYFNEKRLEAFFVKNIENVQGDERDVIIFSVGYGKSSPSEDLKMNFGPINKNGGERRLNVAITRAKYSVILVASFNPTDMRLTESSPEGVKLLHDYIDFAKNGIDVLKNKPSLSANTESPFEDAVYDFLIQKGYKVATQVGCSGYRIDLAIKQPGSDNKFVLGIECDGASYHSSRTARERDRLRQSVLESMGWKLYRIWSTDWIKYPENEGKLLTDAIEKALSSFSEENSQDNRVSSTEFSATTKYFVEEEKKDDTIDEFETFEFISSRELVNFESKLKMLDKIITAQSPIHIEYVYDQMTKACGFERASKKLREEIDWLLSSKKIEYNWINDGMYLWKSNKSIDKPRIPKTEKDRRSFDKIQDEELSMTLRILIKKNPGVKKDELFKIMWNIHKYGKTGNNETLERILSQMKRQKIIQIVDEKIILDK